MILNLLTVEMATNTFILDSVIAQGGFSDINRNKPTPAVFSELTQESLFFFSFVAHMDKLGLSQNELKKEIEPIQDVLTLEKFPVILAEYNKTLRLRYDAEGQLRQSTIYTGMPSTREEFIKLGEKAYKALKQYGAITAIGWQKKNWDNTGDIQLTKTKPNQVMFSCKGSVPIQAIDKWMKRHKVTGSLKSLNEGQKQWSVNEYQHGSLKNTRIFDNQDLPLILKDFNVPRISSLYQYI